MTSVAAPDMCRSAPALGGQRREAALTHPRGIGGGLGPQGCAQPSDGGAQPTTYDPGRDTRVPGPSVDESVSMRSMVPTNCTMSNVPDGSNGSNGWLVCHSACRKRAPACSCCASQRR